MTSPGMEEEEKNTDQQQQQTHPMASPKEEQETVPSHLVQPDDHLQLRLLIDMEEFGFVFQAVEGGLRRLFLRGETAGEGGESSKAGGASAEKSSNLNRSERKSRSALEKLGMKPLTGVHDEVMFVKAVEGNTKLVCSISKPDVFKLLTSENYVIFGELITSLLQQLDDTTDLNESSVLVGEYESDEDEYDTDETGINPGDIELAVSWE